MQRPYQAFQRPSRWPTVYSATNALMEILAVVEKTVVSFNAWKQISWNAWVFYHWCYVIKPMKIRKIINNFLGKFQFEKFTCTNGNFPCIDKHFLGWSANMVKFRVMEIFQEKVEVLENLPA
jgi:hypothetical protein